MELTVYFCLLEFFGGILMSLGGSVPGVSGGTIAFLMGFYDNMINSINSIFDKDKKLRIRSIIHLLIIGFGFLAGLALATFLINRFFEAHIYAISSMFIGITFFSVPLIIREEWKPIRQRPTALLWIIPGAALIVGITLLAGYGLRGVTGWGQVALAFPAGMLASAAMFMPGISGAAIFYIFGLYQTVFASLKQIAHFDFKAFPFLASMAVGIAIGMIVIVKAIRWLLKNQRARTVCTIIGMMLGSIYSMWVGPRTLTPPQDALSFQTFNWWLFLAGGLLIAAFEGLKILASFLRNKKAAAADVEGTEAGENETPQENAENVQTEDVAVNDSSEE